MNVTNAEELEYNIKKLRDVLSNLFRIDSPNIDFGFYRIMNQRRERIENFLNEDLVEAVSKEFGKYEKAALAEIEKKREALEREIISKIDEKALAENGIKAEFLVSRQAKELNNEYQELRKAENEAKMSDFQRAEIYSRLSEFFSRYYKDGDFLPLRRFSMKEKYAIPYNGEEVILHWADKEQYYVKTDRYLKTHGFKVGGYQILFQLAEIKPTENKNGSRFLILKTGEDSVTFDETKKLLIIQFDFRELSADELRSFIPRGETRKNPNKEDIIAGLQESILTHPGFPDKLKNGMKKEVNDESVLFSHLNGFLIQNNYDFFIHKDLGRFLREELETYLKTEILKIDDFLSEDEEKNRQALLRAKVTRDIAEKIISFLAQQEEYQKMLFEKKKLVVSCEYCITLSKIPKHLYPIVASNANQINAWKQLGLLDAIKKTVLGASEKGDKISEELLSGNPQLMVDTAFFDEAFKMAVLEQFDDIDKEIDGIAIKSDNWQALNLIKDRYKGKIRSAYIDPPYNTGNDDFIYRDNYQHDCWLTMMENRLSIVPELLTEYGTLMMSIDDNEIESLLYLSNITFGKDNHVATICHKARDSVSNDLILSSNHHFQVLYSLNRKKLFDHRKFFRLPAEISGFSNPDNDPRGPWKPAPVDGPGGAAKGNPYFTFMGVTGYYRYSQETMQELYDNNELIVRDGSISRKYFESRARENGRTTTTWWDDVGTTTDGTNLLISMFGGKVFTNPKPVDLIEKYATLSTRSDDIILDFFAGSGTTANAVIALNKKTSGKRKYIVIEMGDYFDTVLLPRIQKAVFSLEWKDGVPKGQEGQPHLLKYFVLEQYEDSLNNIEFVKSDGTLQKTLFDIDDYTLKYLLDFESKGSPCRFNKSILASPFNYRIRIIQNGIPHEVAVDLVETLNYLLPIEVKRIRHYSDSNNDNTEYKVVNGVFDNGQSVTVIWRTCPEDPNNEQFLRKDSEFIRSKILIDMPGEVVYINGLFFVPDAKPIEPLFKKLMGA